MSESDLGRRKKKYGLFALAILLLLCAAAAFYLGGNNFAISSAGLVLILISGYLVKISNVHRRTDSLPASGENTSIDAVYRLSPMGWAVGIALLGAFGLSFLYFYKDIVAGGHHVIRLYLVVIVGLVCFIFWGFHILNWIRRLIS